MDDVYHNENFLPSELFSDLNATMLKRYRVHKGVANSQKPTINNIELNELDDYSLFSPDLSAANVNYYLSLRVGVPGLKTVRFLRDAITNEFNMSNPVFGNAWFIYFTNKDSCGWHIDRNIANIPDSVPENSYTFCLYTHAAWEDSWGGKYQTKLQQYSVKPNTLIGCRRSIEHSITPITHNNPELLRMVFVSSWKVDT